MKRSRLAALSLLSIPLLAASALPASAASHAASRTTVRADKAGTIDEPFCESNKSTCTDTGFLNYEGKYVGHDEPSLLFKSGIRGSGNDITYVMTLPKDPKVQPNASGAGGTTWNFQLRPTFWFGLTMCDSESAPEFTKTCQADSDRNNLVGSNPNAPDYIGKHPGTAFMELQFYGPGYVPQFEGFGCTATQYCAAMTIDSRTRNQNTGIENTAACNNFILGGIEPINWAYITRNGKSQAPANPLFTGTFANPNFSAVNPDTAKDLLMNPGDRIRIHMHDTPAGFRTDLTDLRTGQHGSMTASIANGFGHIQYTPNSSTCQEAPYAFHPEYSTANPRGTTWSAHSYNVAMSDEIGHFENCLAIDANGNCTSAGAQDPSLDADDTGCVPGTDSLLVKINGCFSPDGDFDGQSYRNDWPGTNPNPFLDRALHPTPVLFTSPLTRGKNYSTIAFETDLPAIEVQGAQANPPFCVPTTGANCVNPPNGAQFYPFFSTTFRQGQCTWQEGGRFIPGTDSLLVKINGCFNPDGDFDGQSYRKDWPGTNPNPFLDRALHPTPVLFTSPLTRGKNYSTIAFETDLPAIEVQGAQANPPFCVPTTGANCVNPPNGAQFYPFFSTTFRPGQCTWQEGGRFIPGTVNNFGGSSMAEFGPLLGSLYPEPGFTTATLFRNFNSGDMRNPCRAQ